MASCSYCGSFFVNLSSLWGHVPKCTKRRNINKVALDVLLSDPFFAHTEVQEEVELEVEAEQENVDMDEEQENVHMEDELQDEMGLYFADESYLHFQEDLLNKLEQYSRSNGESTNNVKLMNGQFKAGNRSVYIELIKYAGTRLQLSANDNTELLWAIKRMTSAVGPELALPSRYVNHVMAF